MRVHGVALNREVGGNFLIHRVEEVSAIRGCNIFRARNSVGVVALDTL